MDAFVEWIKSTQLSNTILVQPWVWPAAESVHFIGLALLLGTVGLFDLRLMGFFRGMSVRAARELMPFAIVGFLLNLITGLIFLIGAPDQYAHNHIWWYKVIFLGLAGLNAAVFEMTISRRVVYIEANQDTPLLAKFIGAMSLFSWLGVLYWGRMLPFLGDAF